MARSLATRLAEVQKATSKANLHVELLQAFAEHGHSASASESVQFLQQLRKARDGFSERSTHQPEGPRLSLLKWREDCTTHEGFKLLKRRLFAEGGIEALPDDELSRAYNQLRRLSLPAEADQLWPKVQARLAEGKMAGARELLGLWSVAPQEHMAEVDTPLSRAIEQREQRSWQLLSAVSRASDWPGAQTVLRCAGKLSEILPDLSSEDLALIVAQLSSRMKPDVSAPRALIKLADRAKAELLARDGRLETLQLCGLLGSMEDGSDELWPMVRKQLCTKHDLSAQQVMQVCRFLQERRKERGGELGTDDAELFGVVVKLLQVMLNKRAQPGLVSMVSKSLDSVASDFRTCQCLLNSAVRLRKDLYPLVLWRLFVHCGEVGLTSRHPSLKSRLENVASSLEQHGIGNRMPLSEMAAVTEAMRQNGIVLPKCAAQMAEECLQVLRRTEAEVSGAPQHAEADDVAGSAASGPADAAGSAEASASDIDWLAEAQRLSLIFWTQLKKVDAEENTALTAAVETFCAPGADCRLDGGALVKSVEDLEGMEGVSSLRDNLVGHLAARLPAMSPRLLVETSAVVSSQKLRQAVTEEVIRRLNNVHALRRGQDFDDVVAILARWTAWLQAERAAAKQAEEESSPSESSPVPLELLHRIAHMVADSLPKVLERDPAAARHRLAETVAVLSALEPDGIPLASLRQGLNSEATISASWEPVPAAELAFGLSALHAGALPFDTSLRLWRFAGGVLEAKGTDSLPGSQAAKLWAFGLAARHLSSRTVRAAMVQAEEAPAMEAFLTRAEEQARRPERNRFKLDREAGPSALLERLQAALPALLPGKPREERFLVPSTPYVVDVALEDQRLLLLVPRAVHRAVGSCALSGSARLMERTLDAMGWRLQWIWPEQWSARLDSLAESEGKEEALEALRGFLGLGPAAVQGVAAGQPVAA
mmetsp:Transcript_10056/g.31578  ORF Transcript_10056/g.31578 Transcript_10056/m.31578 type:complete len:940 (-) Transcript_10056:26-2845(-)